MINCNVWHFVIIHDSWLLSPILYIRFSLDSLQQALVILFHSYNYLTKATFFDPDITPGVVEINRRERICNCLESIGFQCWKMANKKLYLCEECKFEPNTGTAIQYVEYSTHCIMYCTVHTKYCIVTWPRTICPLSVVSIIQATNRVGHLQ